MHISDRDLRWIAARASTLFERSDDQYICIPEGADKSAAQRFDRWRQVVARGDREKFHKRLAWDGMDEDRIKAALGAVEPADDIPLPAWTQTLDAAIAVASTLDAGRIVDEARFLDPDDPLPFEEIVAPLRG